MQDLEKAQWYLNKLIEIKKDSDSTDVYTSFGIDGQWLLKYISLLT